MRLVYLVNGKKKKTKDSNEDLEILGYHRHNEHVVKVKAKQDIELVSADLNLPFQVNFKDLYFLNGYQSWTDTREYPLRKRLRNVKKSPRIITHMFALDKYGDSAFYKYSIKKSHGYDIFYSKGEYESFIYSLNYKNAYLIIELIKDKRNLHLVSDVKGAKVKKGEEFVIFDYKYFHSYEEGIEGFNEDFHIEPKDKILGYTSWYNY